MDLRKDTPKIIWQTWKTKTHLPKRLKKYRQEWLTTHSDYQHILLDDQDLRDLVKECVPEYLSIYDSFTQNIERVDFARYALLYLKGGVYADLDTIPLKRIDEWVHKGRPVIGCEPIEHAQKIYSRNKVLCNAFMISPPREKVWKDIMDYIVKRYERNYNPVENTGPMAMTRLYEENPEAYKNVLITNPCTFYPLTGTSTISKECDLDRDSYMVHVWENSWIDKHWWESPLVYNVRYWVMGLLAVYALLWIYLCFRH